MFQCQESLGEEVLKMSTEEIVSRTRLLDNEVKIMKSEVMRISHELQSQKENIKENAEKIKEAAHIYKAANIDNIREKQREIYDRIKAKMKSERLVKKILSVLDGQFSDEDKAKLLEKLSS